MLHRWLAGAVLVLVFSAVSPSLPLGNGHTAIGGLLSSSALAKSRVRSMLDRLLGQSMPDGIVKSNGRIEATQVDVVGEISGPPGRCHRRGRHRGQRRDRSSRIVVAGIRSPIAGGAIQRAAREAGDGRGGIVIEQRKAALESAKSDFERGQELIGQADYHPTDIRSAQPQLRSGRGERSEERSRSATRPKPPSRARRRRSSGSSRCCTISCSSRRELDGCNISSLAAAKWSPPAAGRDDTRPAGRLHDDLPAGGDAGKLEIGGEARIVLDPVPQYVIPATVSFVAADAQFTPKTVETKEEREKLMFRVKLKMDAEFLQSILARVKTGVRGIGIVRTDRRDGVAGRPASQAAAMTDAVSRAGSTNVSHRYGAIDRAGRRHGRYSSAHHGGRDRPRRGRQVHLAGADFRRAQNPERQGRGLRRRYRRCDPPQSASRPHRLHAAGTGPQSLSDAQRVREHRFLRPAVRTIGVRAKRPHHRAVDRDRRSIRSRIVRPASFPAG